MALVGDGEAAGVHQQLFLMFSMRWDSGCMSRCAGRRSSALETRLNGDPHVATTDGEDCGIDNN